MHVTLINPAGLFFNKSDITQSHCLGILYIAAWVRKHGHHVTVVDALKEGIDQVDEGVNGVYRAGLSEDDTVDRIPEHTDCIGVSTPFSHLAGLVHSLVDRIKERRPQTPVVMGGVYVSTQPEIAITSNADYLILGEGEVPFLELIEYLHNGSQDELSNAVIPVSDPEKLIRARSFQIPNFADLPPPARDLVPFKDYLSRSQRNIRGLRVASITTSRGCPYDCEFCSIHPVNSRIWRALPPEQVLAEVDDLVENYGVNHLEIEDDMFTLKRDRVIAILRGFIERQERGVDLTWSAHNGLRIGTLDDEVIGLIRRSRCTKMNIALESGDPEMLRIIRKKLDLNKVLEVAGLAHKWGINCSVFVIYGYPGETRERFENAVRFYQKLKRVAPSLNFEPFITQPYPGTPLFKRAVLEGLLPADMFSTAEKMNYFSTENRIWLETPDFDKEEVQRRGRVLRKTVLSRSAYLKYRVRTILPDQLVNQLRTSYHLWKVGLYRLGEYRSRGRQRRVATANGMLKPSGPFPPPPNG